MRFWTVHLPPAPQRAGTEPVLLREGFSFWALVFGPFWLAFHRAWIPAVLFLCAGLAATLLPAPLATAAPLALAWATGLFGRDMVRWSLARRGWLLAHVIAADDEEAALARLLAARPELVPS
jgi:hypothetical protein